VTKVDKIILEGLEFYAYHGVLRQEKELGQRFIIDLNLELDLKKAGETDRAEDTVSYQKVFESVQEIVTSQKFNLLEALAEAVAREVLTQYPLVCRVEVTVKKPQAPVAGSFKYMAVQIARGRFAAADG